MVVYTAVQRRNDWNRSTMSSRLIVSWMEGGIGILCFRVIGILSLRGNDIFPRRGIGSGGRGILFTRGWSSRDIGGEGERLLAAEQ